MPAGEGDIGRMSVRSVGRGVVVGTPPRVAEGGPNAPRMQSGLQMAMESGLVGNVSQNQ